MTKNKAVLGIYKTRREVESAINGFRDAGFSNSDISLILPEHRRSEEADSGGHTHTKMPHKATKSGSGAAARKTFNRLVGVSELTIPEIGPIIAAGPVMTALTGTGSGTASNHFSGILTGLGISESEAQRYRGALRKGQALAVIHCETLEEMQRACEIMEITCAEDITRSNKPGVGHKSAA
jgi:hypothetical protein